MIASTTKTRDGKTAQQLCSERYGLIGAQLEMLTARVSRLQEEGDWPAAGDLGRILDTLRPLTDPNW